MANLYRSRNNKILGGVCAGLADRFNLSISGVRLVSVVALFFGVGTPVLVYLILWVVLKEQSTGDTIDV